MRDQLTVCNIDLHNNFGSNKDLFFNRVKHLEQMRTSQSDESFTYFISSDYELDRLRKLHSGIRTGKIDFLDYDGKKSMHVFALNANKKIVDWLYTSSPKELDKQIIAWMAVVYFLDSNRRDLLDRQFHRKLLARAKKLIQERFSKYFSVSLDRNNIYKPTKGEKYDLARIHLKYKEICIDFFGREPVYPLDNPWGYGYREDEFGVIGPKINFQYSFMYERDWKTIVLEGIPDNLMRAESASTLVRDWKEVITKHQIHAHHVYNQVDGITLEEYATQEEGFVYLLSNPAFKAGIYKIGFTTKNVEERANGLYTTGVPIEFDIEFRMPVNNLRKIENTIHSDLKQFRFNKGREFFLGDKEQFIKTIKRYRNLR